MGVLYRPNATQGLFPPGACLVTALPTLRLWWASLSPHLLPCPHHPPCLLLPLRVLTIHNNPEDLTLAPGLKHLRQVLADTDSADISQYFNAAYEFINEGVQKQQRE